MNTLRNIAIAGMALLSSFSSIFACTNLLVTKGASVDGSNLISYAADSHTLYGELYHWPAATYPAGTKLKVYEWDTGKYLGEIDQAEKTYSVVGNMNENQVAIGETTFGGRHECVDSTGIIDYGSLIYITLQRATSARHAIEIMTNLVDKYGYYSSGESFSIADPEEVWILEMIGKGPENTGAVWVAKRIPDGMVSAHANQARITTIDFKDKKNCLYARDVISFAREKGWFDGKNTDFSFSDVYAPLDYGAIRFCEARVWSFYNAVNPTEAADYFDYIEEGNHNRMPLWFKPTNKLSYRDVQNVMRDHFEGTPLDMTADVGAGPFKNPYRWRPLTWDVDSTTYFNERAIATQQTGFSFVAQLRSGIPNPIGGILWFGVDDAATSVYTPIYCGTQEIPECFAVGNGDMLNFSWTSAFWIFNWVSNMAYTRYSYISEDVKKVMTKLEDNYEAKLPLMDAKAKELYAKNPQDAINFVTDYSVSSAQNMFYEWKKLGEFLMVKYIDGNIKKEENGNFIRNPYGLPASPDQPGYSDEYYRSVVKDTDDKLKMKGEAAH